MSTAQSEIEYSNITRVAGQTEQFALDVEPSCGKNRAYTDTVERADGLFNSNITVGTTATPIRCGAQNATNRRGILVQNHGSLSIFVGSATVTVTNGFEVGISSSFFFGISENVTIYAIASAGPQDIRVMEVT